mmetsp:Transcript_7610/g.10981  ORF Transcript_7610/g.10981 Transcript_7610/m.10981 type:complete len:217 (-) Transcript_7610:78-728(-)|eukprot:CAMPEP_0202469426 /NCGR_PEP_ID=MMETSP1360-20130828/78449_1 /ASSEMBLY_ACC=CAM_ASM_000848 /TAXON_ID=515479 /ORGANISM="Licmophora paradoxa, Strain CCMP2313" /LENGTH=216 /DNA_ID=CAMNT_0049094763 /DNA_START=52 /DNA_END=702 /DNA_ORIENTATION=-
MSSLTVDLCNVNTSLGEAAKEVSPDSLQLLEISVDASHLYNPMELSNFIPKLKSGAVIKIKVSGEGDLKPIHTSLLLAGLKVLSERVEAGNRVLTAERKSKTSTRSKPITLVQQDDDLLDEDDLLDDELAPPSMTPREVTGDDCGGRKACDDCTCGRAERETTQEEKKEQMESIPTSNCGNCAKGDAFRCANCPYLGKPAFKAGEEHLVLELVDDF